MSTRNAFERRSAILSYLREHERASTRQLSDVFGVSEVTIRSDLSTLEESGKLARQHGGAEFTRQRVNEQPFDMRRFVHLSEKVEIARAAADLVTPGDQILLDASTTAYQLARELKERSNLTIITNNVHAALLLGENPAIDVLLLGGQLRSSTGSLVGLPAIEMLGKLHARYAFFGTAGATLERGLTDADMREVQVKQAMLEAADEGVVILDASKFGLRALRTFAAFSDIDHLVTDAGIPSEYVVACRELGIDLITV